MIRPLILFFLILGIFITKSSFCQGLPPSLLSGIHITENSNNILFEPYIVNRANINYHDLSYNFIVKKTGVSGTSSSSQTGKISISAQDSLNLSKISINCFPGDSCISCLKLFKNSILIETKTKEFISPVNKQYKN
jgi:hypothetical protein